MRTATLLLMTLGLWVGFSPAVYGQSFLDQLEKQLQGGQAAPAAAPQSPATTKPAKSGYLGLYADEGLPGAGGVQVTQLVVGGPASQAGIRAGDTITAIDGQPVKSLADMSQAMQGKAVGARLRFEVVRNGKTTEHVVQLGDKKRPQTPATEIPQALPLPERPAEPNQPVPTDRERPDASGVPRRAALGVSVTDVTDEDVLRYGLRARRGAIVRSVKANSPARRFGVTVGSLIIVANGRNLSGADDLVDVIAGLTPDDSIELSYYIGKQLYTKTIPLGDAAISKSPSPRSSEDPALRILPQGEDRPLLRGLERALNGIVRTPVDAAAVEDENTALKRQVEALREELRQARGRITELEKQLSE